MPLAALIDETIAHAKAVAGRAATVLSRSHLDSAGQIAKVNPAACVACATCVKVCPYGAPMINDLKKTEIQGAKCMGYGSYTAACPAHTITLQHQECGQMTGRPGGLAPQQYPSKVRVMHVPCTGKIEMEQHWL